ncbi:MAG: primosomal protein N' [Planctomycetes bacterium]|nr:primosomal protein N' [Planctomycetota bacterium]MBU4399484.1 primosomal protein N' [Planctomycetota bacterium]MCG2682817.1 primosomal protein N' [Planctomycetales bacterium]
MSAEQRQLFDSSPEPWEADDQSRHLVASVVLSAGGAKEFDYLIPDALRESVDIGRRVKIPLGPSNRLVTGYCVRIEDRPVGRRRLKPLHSVLDQRGLLSPAMLRLTRWIADHYLCDWATVLDAVVPAGVRVGAGTRMTTLLSIDREAVERLGELKLTAKQREVLNTLAASEEPMTPGELARAARCTQGPVTALRRKGLIRARTGRIATLRPEESSPAQEKHLVLNPDQEHALRTILDAMNSRRQRTILIHGVTGSGKTEVYIQAIQEVIHFGRQAIVLVPEISLTPQTVERFRRRFSAVAVLHSHLSDAERHWHWQRIAEGSVSVVVGARSAVFAPTPNLGLIVLDEEHETSFKQESAPRYHARDVALARAEAEGIPLVLGSATPSLESWRRAKAGEFALVEMPRRVLDRPLPTVGTIDLRAEKGRACSRGSISRQLHTAIAAALDEGGQVILLLNRRGFSTHIQCPACGHVVRCPECDIALTHHRKEEIALCHYCDYEVPAPATCPECGFAGIRYSGLGTQRLEAEVRARFPNVLSLRMDTDAMQAHGSHQRALSAFRAGKVRILLGTQMIAKGLDFPNVTLVGVINADTAMHLPDFRAAERTFQLVTQVAGRTGRGPKGGRVLVQTFSPDHPAIRAAVRHDYETFAAGELPIREMLRYPPFTSMIRLVVRGPVEPVAAGFATYVAERLRAALRRGEVDARVLGPAPCPFARLRGKHRFQIQVQGSDGDRLRAAVADAAADLEPPDDVLWIVDVDPVDML